MCAILVSPPLKHTDDLLFNKITTPFGGTQLHWTASRLGIYLLQCKDAARDLVIYHLLPGSCAWESGFGLTRSPAIGSHKACQDDVTRLKSLRELDSGQDIIYMTFKTAWLRSNSCLALRKLPSSNFSIQSMTPPQSFQLPRSKKNYWCHPILPGSLRPPGPAESWSMWGK